MKFIIYFLTIFVLVVDLQCEDYVVSRKKQPIELPSGNGEADDSLFPEVFYPITDNAEVSNLANPKKVKPIPGVPFKP